MATGSASSYFSADDGYIHSSSTEFNLAGNKNYSVVGWYKHAGGSGWHAIVNYGNSSPNRWGIWKESGGGWHFRWNANDYMNTGTAITTNWTHFGGTYSYDNGDAYLYLDGAVDSSDLSADSAANGSDQNLELANRDTANYTTGNLSHLRFYSKELSQEEIQEIMYNPNVVFSNFVGGFDLYSAGATEYNIYGTENLTEENSVATSSSGAPIFLLAGQ